MTQVVHQELTSEMISFLQGEKLVLLCTIDHETGEPNVTCISWVLANSPSEIQFAIDPRSRVIDNLNAASACTLSFIGLGSCFAISGHGHSDGEQLPGVSIKMTGVKVKVQEIRDVLFYGGKISQEPDYVKTYDAELAKKLDGAVYAALGKE